MTNPMDPSSRGAKRRSGKQVKEEMLTAASELVHTHGLTVSLQHISLDAIAFGAGIPRSAVYRVWPTREDFFNELLLKLAGEPESTPVAFDSKTLDAAIAALKKELEKDPDVLSHPQGRRLVLIEMCRRGATVNYDTVASHEKWRTYVALAATALSYAEPMRTEMQKKIDQVEGLYLTGMADFYESVGQLLGRRIRPQFRSDPKSGRHPYAYLAATGAATVEGLVLRNSNLPKTEAPGLSPDLSAPADKVDPFDTGREEQWSAAAVTFTGTFLAMTEAVPDDQYIYSRDHVEEQVQGLERKAQSLKAAAHPLGS